MEVFVTKNGNEIVRRSLADYFFEKTKTPSLAEIATLTPAEEEAMLKRFGVA